ncbi:type II toxin-antitoxin system RelE/ParE family toxin [Chlorobium sp. N1]|uniref:type II toxin-antitoxin system RelE/ParE family toxin n=1 Tax=Chlorobium sp. N1 TaxID=2491138 RepID=UPI00104065D4|nr:type II toxin-antitoxin system RelE/ParE family toxin [Chlorobium sp. N1]TCD46840.1 type II toxin-antitoxin system RelE/ParE family toxin [Chlorobium sp. N1]
MRVFKNRFFNRWADAEGVSDDTLWTAAKDVALGYVEADLGKCLFKKRIARQNVGKSKGFRVLVGYRKPDSSRVVFLYAFAKNERSSITQKEKKALQLVAREFVDATDEQIAELLSSKEYREIPAYE